MARDGYNSGTVVVVTIVVVFVMNRYDNIRGNEIRSRVVVFATNVVTRFFTVRVVAVLFGVVTDDRFTQVVTTDRL
jgi:hypothetical protein